MFLATFGQNRFSRLQDMGCDSGDEQWNIFKCTRDVYQMKGLSVYITKLSVI